MPGNVLDFWRGGETAGGAAKQQESLRERVQEEIEWLRRGPKARGTKAKARIEDAHGLIGEAGGCERADADGESAGIEFAGDGAEDASG